MKELIRDLTAITAPSSYEEPVADYIEKYLKKHNKELKLKRDVLGNLIARRPGKGKKIMLAAHMDEIGFIVKHIDKNGFLRFAMVGGIFPHNIVNSHVTFVNGTEGIIGIEEKNYNYKDILPLSKLFIDIGAKTKAEAEKKVQIGSLAGVKHNFVDMGSRISTKALDDRIGCTLLMELAKNKIKGDNDIYFVFTSQEEVGTRGAKTSAYAIDPDLAIAVDVTDTGDTPETNVMEVYLGKGPTIKIKDSGILVRKKVIDYMTDIAEKNKIPYQYEILEFGGTDAGPIHMTKSGVLSGVLSIPTRYIHSKAEMIDMSDYENGIKLLRAVLEDDISKKGF